MEKTFIVLLLVCVCFSGQIFSFEERSTITVEQKSSGEEAYMEYCNKCHPGGKAGLGPSIVNKPLPKFLIKFQVRNGLGVMPSFDKETIPDEELDKLVKYIQELKS